MSLRLTSAADYAVLAMIHMACRPEDAVSLRRDIADAYDIPSTFMAKILRALVRAGLVRSTRGIHGGYRLGRPATEISVLDIVEAIEGPLQISACAAERPTCRWSNDCPAHAVWCKVRQQLATTLRENTLEMLVCAPRKHGRVAVGS